MPKSLAETEITGSGAVDTAYHLWLTLGSLGLKQVFFAPGSRSAPLVYGFDLAAKQISSLNAHVRIDERSAAFNALGVGMASGQPAAVVTTSGTATAHLLAAVMEAHHARIPLIVITADRPAELRGTGANQTTNQVGIYRNFTAYEVDVPAPGAQLATEAEVRLINDVGLRAWQTAISRQGPVHLNLGFRDPLTPNFSRIAAAEKTATATTVETSVTSEIPKNAQEFSLDAKTTLVLAGNRAGRSELLNWVESNQLPIIAEPGSGIRQCVSDNLVYRGNQILNALLAKAHVEPGGLYPQRIIAVGHLTLTRPVQQIMRREDIELVVVDPAAQLGKWRDPARRAKYVLSELPELIPAVEQPAFLEKWQQEDKNQRAAARRVLNWQTEAALQVWSALGEDEQLLLASSSLIRDIYLYGEEAGAENAEIYASRGLAGIDGTYATGCGIAIARPEQRTRVLLGDLAAIHDLSSLVVGSMEEVPNLDLIVIDDDGGRIFSGLEHAGSQPELMRRFFTTPHGVNIAEAARGLNIDATEITAGDSSVIARWLGEPAAGIRMLVIRQG